MDFFVGHSRFGFVLQEAYLQLSTGSVEEHLIMILEILSCPIFT